MCVAVRLLLLGFCAESMLLAGCYRHRQQPAPAPPTVTVAHPIRQQVTDYGEHTGTLVAVRTIDVRARVQGWLEKMYYVPGATVATDALLFLIEPSQYQAAVNAAKANLMQQQASLDNARRNWDRAKALGPSAALSQMEYDTYRYAYEAAAANVAASRANLEQAQLNLDYTQVRSPIAGRVGRNQVDVGNLVGASSQPTVLATVVSIRPIYVYFTISESEYLALRRMYGVYTPQTQASRPASPLIPVTVGLEDETGYPHKGTIDYVEIRVDPTTGTATVRGVLDNTSGLLVPGLYARVRVPERTYQAVLVDDVAVTADQRGQYVLVVNDQDVVERRAVTAGETIDRMRVIQEGLTPADRVVVNGMQRARPGAKVQVMD